MSRPLASMTESPIDATPYSSPVHKTPEDHPYVEPRSTDSRSPCPALNTLANHGYIERSGRDIDFFELINALHHVYNLTWVLAVFLAGVGYYISGKFTFTTRAKDPELPDTFFNRMKGFIPLPRWRIQLASLSIRGEGKLAHNASMAHPDYVASHAPDKSLIAKLLSYTRSCSHGPCRCGLSLIDIAHYHKKRENELSSPLNPFHRKVALGECGLAWAVMRRRCDTMDRKGSSDSTNSERDDIIPDDILQRWLGCERLPDDWWSVGNICLASQ